MSANTDTLKQALTHHQAGRLDQAESLYQQIIRVHPQHADALHLLGVAAHQRNQHQTAIEFISRAVQLKRSSAPFRSNLGAAYRALGRMDDAIASYREALQLSPDSAEVHYNLGNALKDLDRFDEAVESYRRALSLRPQFAEAHNNLGDALKCLGRLDEAIASHKRAIHIQSDMPEAHFNLGNAFKRLEQLDDAADSYRSALRHKPEYLDAHVNLGFVLEDQQRVLEAVDCYERALAIDADSAEAHFNRSLAWLRLGDFQRGWPEYEWRWKRKVSPREFKRPVWDGAPLANRSLFVYAEQGLGDEILFCSCLPQLLDQTAECLIECDRRLLPLFARSFPSARLLTRPLDADAELLSSVDCQVAMGSLPRSLRPTLDSFPRQTSYLKPDPQLVQTWRTRFQKLDGRLKVGISWRGGKEADVRRKRSTTLDQWTPLLSMPELCLVNLQYGVTEQELASLRQQHGVSIHDWADVDPLVDLESFAAQIAALDLVISVDNSTVHLAGALGAEVWTLLPFASDWRWLLETDRSPWYGSMRLFRQNQPGCWEAVFDQVARRLRAVLCS